MEPVYLNHLKNVLAVKARLHARAVDQIYAVIALQFRRGVPGPKFAGL
jgi:hypothetical protein